MEGADSPVYRVLIVDDLPEIRMMVRTRLRMMPDVEVVGEASNGREAIRLVAALAPEAVILDLEMPVMRGDEAIPRMRELAPGIRILLYSGADQATLDEIAEVAKPDAMVSKGGALSEVVTELRALLDMGPYDVLRFVLDTISLDQAVTVFDTWVGLNVRIFESLARGDELERAQLGGASVEELEALIGVYAHLGDNLQRAARERETEVVPIIHLLRTTAAAARRALVAFDDAHLADFYKAWDYVVPAHAAAALNEMRDHLLAALPTSGAEEPEELEESRPELQEAAASVAGTPASADAPAVAGGPLPPSIIILATVQVVPDRLEEALRKSQEHVERSRAEPGCISHAVHQASEDPNRLVFVEQWADRAAMNTHFGVPAARSFARELGDLAAAPPDMKIYEAEPLS